MTVAAESTNALEGLLKELVRRHLDLVYAAALRQMHDPHAAADVTQAVFLILQTKLPTFNAGVIIPVWLLWTTRYTCLAAKRQERRRAYHEAKVKAMYGETQGPAEENDACMEEIDEALCKVPEADRAALVLAYFEGRSHAEIGQRMGISTEAAHKRVQRAVKRLRKLLLKKEVAVGSVTSTLTAVGSPASAPAAVCNAVLNTLSGHVSVALQTLARRTVLMMSMGKMMILAVVLVLACGGLAIATSSLGRGAAPQSPAAVASASAPATTRAASPFGPTIELVIHDAELVDLDAGKIVERPAPRPGEWPSTEGVDLSYDRNSDDVGDAIIGYEMMAAQMSASNFDSDWRPINNVKSLLMVNQPARPLLSTAGDLHAYVIRTRAGKVGFLEIVSRQDARGRAKADVTIRFRFLLPAAREQVVAEMVSQDELLPGWTFLGALQEDIAQATKAAAENRLGEARTAALHVQQRVHWLDLMAKGTSFEIGVHKAGRAATRLLDLEESEAGAIAEAVGTVQKALVGPVEAITKAGVRTDK